MEELNKEDIKKDTSRRFMGDIGGSYEMYLALQEKFEPLTYRHYKGKQYVSVGYVYNATTDDVLFLYADKENPTLHYCRSLADFHEVLNLFSGDDKVTCCRFARSDD